MRIDDDPEVSNDGGEEEAEEYDAVTFNAQEEEVRSIASSDHKRQMKRVLNDFVKFVALSSTAILVDPDADGTSKEEKSERENHHYSISQLSLCVQDGLYDHTPVNGDAKLLFDACYIMGDVLGQGGYATVFRSRHRKNKQWYAVKQIFCEEYDEDGANDLRAEVAAMRRLGDCPNVVRLHDVFWNEPHERNEGTEGHHDSYNSHSSSWNASSRRSALYDCTFLILEMVEGGDLLDALAERDVFCVADARRTSRTLLEAVRFCHRRHVAHRDLKPENILLASRRPNETNIKLADFGCSKRWMERDGDTEHCGGKGYLFTLCGSPHYVAPELYTHSGGYDARCDIWSAGIVIYVLLGGYAPFDGNTQELPSMICEGSFGYDEKYWHDVPQPPRDLIEMLLKVNPDERATLDEALKSEWLRRRDKELWEEFNRKDHAERENDDIKTEKENRERNEENERKITFSELSSDRQTRAKLPDRPAPPSTEAKRAAAVKATKRLTATGKSALSVASSSYSSIDTWLRMQASISSVIGSDSGNGNGNGSSAFLSQNCSFGRNMIIHNSIGSIGYGGQENPIEDIFTISDKDDESSYNGEEQHSDHSLSLHEL